MGLSRRFLNLIVGSDRPTRRSLRCIDLKRLQLFHAAPPSPSSSPRPPPPTTMEKLVLPGPTPNFHVCSAHAWVGCSVACYPLGQRKVLCTDQCGRNFLYDANKHEVAAMPEFHRPRLDSLSLFIPSGHGEETFEDKDDYKEGSEDEEDDRVEGDEEGDDRGESGSLFLMETTLRPVTGDSSIWHPSDDLEILFYGNDRVTSHCRLVPPPPYVHEPSYWNAPSEIDSYAVVGSGSHVCISGTGTGTYFLDTASYAWNKVGDWTLPFQGKVEYVPELQLWFGLSADAQHLVAADLFTTDSQPRLVGSWKEFEHPEEWIECRDAQLVNLGSGRFCIARFFTYESEEGDFVQDFVVMTSLEVVAPCALDGDVNGNGKVKLEMIPHKSMLYMTAHAYGTNIDLVF